MATEWRPDTCGCIIQYEGDLQFAETVSACAKHAAHNGQASHLDELLKHNRRKNEIVQRLADDGLDPQTVGIGYDPAAPVDNDPVIVIAPNDQVLAAADSALKKIANRPGVKPPVLRRGP